MNFRELEQTNQDSNNVYYFAYGMLTDPDNMQGAKYIAAAVLAKYKLELLTHANIVPDNSQVVYGTLWLIDRDMLEELDMIEGYPYYYDRIQVTVTNQSKNYLAYVYVMTDNSRQRSLRSTPSQYYLDQIANGYRHAGIPLEQLALALRQAKRRVDKYKDEDQ